MAEQARRRAVITGASLGIGAALAQHLAGRDFDLIVNARSVDALDDLKVRTAQLGANTVVIPGDLRDAAVVEQLAAASAEPPVDLLIVGTSAQVDPEDEAFVKQLATERLAEILDVTARVPMEVFRALRNGMANPAKVIFLASDWALPGSHGPSVFSAAKAALLQFARTERRASAADGIQISVLVPGEIATYDADWKNPVWTLDDSTDRILEEFGGSRISLHEIVAAVEFILGCRTARVDEMQLSPIDAAYDY